MKEDEEKTFIRRYVAGQDVLDVGVGDEGTKQLHRFIKKYAKTVTGVELDEERTRRMNKQGFNIILGDAETVKLKKKFDVIVAGDMIEHLDNVGVFLDNMKKHLKTSGVFIINTYNIYSFNFAVRSIVFGGRVYYLDEHTIGYTEQLLREILRRHGFKVEKLVYWTHVDKTISSRIVYGASKISQKWNENILIIAKPGGN